MFVSNYKPNGSRRDAIFRGNGRHRFPVGVAGANGIGNALRQLGASVFAAAVGAHEYFYLGLKSAPSPFGCHIKAVVAPRAKPQMGRIAARRIIAGVADSHAVRYRAMRQLIRQAMCGCNTWAASETAMTGLTVASAVSAAGPWPTCAWFADGNSTPEM